MIPLYTETEFNESKSRDPLPLKCEYCGGTFMRSKHDIHAALNPNRKRNDSCRFCGNSCQRKNDVGELIDTECGNCQIERSSVRQFCQCSHQYVDPAAVLSDINVLVWRVIER